MKFHTDYTTYPDEVKKIFYKNIEMKCDVW